MTKIEMLNSIKEVLTDAEQVAFIEEMIAQTERKAEKARERAAAKKEAGDELREAIFNILSTETFKTIPEILAEIDDEEITPAKVTARLSQLVKLDRVVKEKVKTDNGDKMGYAIALVEAE